MCQKCKGLFGCNVHLCQRASMEQPGSPQASLARRVSRGEKQAARTSAKPSLAGMAVVDAASKQ